MLYGWHKEINGKGSVKTAMAMKDLGFFGNEAIFVCFSKQKRWHKGSRKVVNDR